MRMKFIALAFVAFLGGGLLLAQPAVAAPSPECENTSVPLEQANCTLEAIDPGGTTIGEVLRAVLNILSYIVGASSIIVIIILSLRLVLSGGDSKTVKEVRDGIIYALVGLVLAGLAQGMVFFVLDKI